jgi:hypothetical protein
VACAQKVAKMVAWANTITKRFGTVRLSELGVRRGKAALSSG